MLAARMGTASAVIAAGIGLVMTARSSETPPHTLEMPAADLPPDPIRITAHEPAIESCVAPDDSELAGDEAMLASYWRVGHPCEPLPPCMDPHPIVALSADLDETDGIERVIANKRFGAAMLSAHGELLGFYEAECRNRSDRDYIKLSARNFTGGPRPQLVIRERTNAHCGEFDSLTVVRRSHGELEPILRVDEGGKRGCNVWQGESRARISVKPGAVDVIRTGWIQSSSEQTNWEYGPRRHVRTECRLRLAADGRFDRIDAGRRTLEPPGDIACD